MNREPKHTLEVLAVAMFSVIMAFYGVSLNDQYIIMFFMLFPVVFVGVALAMEGRL